MIRYPSNFQEIQCDKSPGFPSQGLSFSENSEKNLKIWWVIIIVPSFSSLSNHFPSFSFIVSSFFPSFSHLNTAIIWGLPIPNMSGKRPGVRTTNGLTGVFQRQLGLLIL